MMRWAGALLALLIVLSWIHPVSARPEYLDRFKADPYRRSNADGCTVCHDNPMGGGSRNEFGAAFLTAGRLITPMMRASFPDRFEVQTLRMPDGTLMYFSDPGNQFVVYKKRDDRFLIDLAAISTKVEKDIIPPPENRMGFFVTSTGIGKGGHLGGVAGADRHCQALAKAAGGPAADRTWRAYLSTSYDNQPAVNAGDRIGTGPWYNAKGLLIARGVADLHGALSRLNKDTALNEKGQPVDVAVHGILTGTGPDGRAVVGANCNNWTSSTDGKAVLGHFDRQGQGDNPTSWNSARQTNGCSQEAFKAAGSDGLLYCFAIR